MKRHFAHLLILCVLASCRPSPELKVVAVMKLEVESLVTGVNAGTVRAEREVDLAFGMVGRVRKLNVRIGDQVEEGAILAELENDDLNQILHTAKHDLDRTNALLRSKVLATTDNDNAERAYEIARANFEKSLIRAPFRGVVTELNLEVGQLSQITAVIPKPLIRLVDNEPRYVRVEIDEADLPKVKLGLPARVRVSSVRKEPFSGTVRRIIPYVSAAREQDRTVTIDLDLPTGDSRLPVGSSADVEIVVDTEHGMLTVPARSVLGRGTNRYVYVVRDGVIAKTPVQLGLMNYDRAAVRSGLANGDMIALPSDTVELVDGLKVIARTEQWP